VIVFMALARGGTSRLRAPPAAGRALSSLHLPTAVHFAERLSGATFRITESEDGCQLVECDGVGARPSERAARAAT